MSEETTIITPEVTYTSYTSDVQLINKSYVTRKAKKEMIDVHSQKYIKAWLDKIQYKEKIDELTKDYNLLSPEAKQRVDSFVDRRLAQPEGEMLPEAEIQHAVAVKLGLDTVTQNYKSSCTEFDFYERIINLIKNI